MQEFSIWFFYELCLVLSDITENTCAYLPILVELYTLSVKRGSTQLPKKVRIYRKGQDVNNSYLLFTFFQATAL